jgi:hypothetical protein
MRTLRKIIFIPFGLLAAFVSLIAILILACLDWLTRRD